MFTTEYYDYEINNDVDFTCSDQEPLASGFCIFHDKDYLQDKTNYDKRKRKVLDRLKRKVNHAIFNNEQLLCIGFHLPDFSLSDLGIISKEFTEPVYFNDSQFLGYADFSDTKFQEIEFSRANFKERAYFFRANFKERAVNFSNSEFYSKTYFSGNSTAKQNLIMYYLKEKRKLPLT